LEDLIIAKKPTYEEPEQRAKELEKEAAERKLAEMQLQRYAVELEKSNHELELFACEKGANDEREDS